MATFFDALTVACFIGLVLSGTALAIANHLGNTGHEVLGYVLVVAAMGFGWLSFSKPRRGL